MLLPIDIGNTTYKWKLVDTANMLVSLGTGNGHEDSASLVDLRQTYPIRKVMVANVAAEQVVEEIKAVFSDCEFRQIHSTTQLLGLTNSYQEPSRLGVDRWIAMVEAFYLAELKPVCVIDFGTAITLDVVGDRGLHQGGFIVPSHYVMQEALIGATAKISVEQDRSSLCYGKNTTQAVQNGIHTMITRWLESEIVLFKSLYKDGVIYTTGGAALNYPLSDTVHNPTLVLDGLLRIAMQS